MVTTTIQRFKAAFLEVRVRCWNVVAVVNMTWSASRTIFVAFFSLNIISGILPFLYILANSHLIDVIVGAHAVPRSPEDALETILVPVLMLASVAITSHIIARALLLLSDLFQKKAATHVQRIVTARAAVTDLSYFEEPSFNDLMQNASNEAAHRPVAIVLKSVQFANVLIGLLFAATFLLKWNWALILLTIGPPAITFWIGTRLSRERVRIAIDRTRDERRILYFRSLFTSDTSAKEFRVLGLQKYFLIKIDKLWDRFFKQDVGIAKRDFGLTGVAGGMLSINVSLVIAYFGIQAVQGNITIGQFALYSQSAAAFNIAITRLLALIREIHESSLFLDNFFRFIRVKSEIEGRHTSNPSVRIANNPTLEFVDVSFKYPGSDVNVLANLNLILRPMEAVALIGENGAGKSTIVKLIAGFYEPTAGKILLDNIDINHLSRDVVREKLAIIFQDKNVYHLSVRDNVGIGHLAHADDMSRIVTAAKKAGLHKIVESWPRSYDTMLGRYYERGIELSGGQRELVAHARALMREAPILVMDEPTASLDLKNESRFLQDLLKSRDGTNRSIIIISHRLSTVRHADRILVLSNGCIVEAGSHDELIRKGGHYAALNETQRQMAASEKETRVLPKTS